MRRDCPQTRRRFRAVALRERVKIALNNIFLKNASRESRKVEKEKAYLHSVFPDEKIATNFFKTIQGNLKQVKEFIKIEISEGEVVFNQNSLSQD